ncbi:hypothetical protein EIP86_009985 [Pleurotus ostreatoroseus]|nr:hypothetical protein EIP86_009985 [Pleurotus ostreatoroseus]
METTAVQLDVYNNWWLWRGCLRDYWPAWTDNPLSEVPLGYPPWDPIDYDGTGYNAALAFPATKPNYDVFGIPQRTRKQRGWYQIQAFGRASQSSVSPHSSSKPVTSADLPMKVIENVMETIARGAERKALASCSLVSRRWYQRMVPRLFGYLQVTSRRQAVGLRDISLSPSRQFLRYANPRIELSVSNVLEFIRKMGSGLYLNIL